MINLKQMKKLESKIKIALAPMAGITDSSFRVMNMLGGSDVLYSEMAHVNALSYGSKKTFELLKADPREKEYIIQLFGNDPLYFKKATQIISTDGVPAFYYVPISNKSRLFIEKLLAELGDKASPVFNNFYKRFSLFEREAPTQKKKRIFPAGLNINLGCPAKKVFFHGSGAALFKDQTKTLQVIESVLSSTELPVSVKIRTEVESTTMFDFLKAISKLPVETVIIHGRSLKQGFAGKVDFPALKKIAKQYPQKKFWFNGGINSVEEAREIIKKTGCSNLAIARGSWGDPTLAEKIKQGVSRENLFLPTDEITRKRELAIIALIHAELNWMTKKKHGMLEMRKHLAWYFKDFAGAKELRKKLVLVKSIAEIRKILGREVQTKKGVLA